mgnify:CR=1 FL=1
MYSGKMRITVIGQSLIAVCVTESNKKIITTTKEGD